MNDFTPPDRSRPTIVDVARRAEVSIGTASRVINGFTNVNAELRTRVNAAIAELGYRPNTNAQDMRRGQTRLVGIVVRDITVPVLAQFVQSAQDALFKAGYSVLIASSNNEVERERALLEILHQRRVDGLITTIASEEDADLRAALVALGAPVVLLDRDEPRTFDAVMVDHHFGTREAIGYLLDLGHRRIAMLTGEPNIWPSFERIRGYEAAYAARGVPVDRSLICAESFTEAFASRKTSSLLSNSSGVTAIFAGGIAMLPGILHAVRARGLRIPDDISIVSGCDSSLATLFTPPITAVRWDFAEVGAVAAQLLVERMRGKTSTSSRRLSFRTEVIRRGSCGRVPDLAVGEAAREEMRHSKGMLS